MTVPHRSRSAVPPAARQAHLPHRPPRAGRPVSPALQVQGSSALVPIAAPASSALASLPATARRRTAGKAARRSKQPAASVTRLSRHQAKPSTGLRLLIATQRTSLLGASLITTAALILYGWTVYTQQQWSKQYSQFRRLQRHEQQLITATGALESQILQNQAAAPSELRMITPDMVVELSPAPIRPGPAPASPVVQTQAAPHPIGY